MALIQRRGEKGLSPVKNLGWLIRHAADVVSITVEESTYPEQGEVFLIVELSGPVERFTTWFASRTVCRQWLAARRSLKGVSVNFEGETVQL